MTSFSDQDGLGRIYTLGNSCLYYYNSCIFFYSSASKHINSHLHVPSTKYRSLSTDRNGTKDQILQEIMSQSKKDQLHLHKLLEDEFKPFNQIELPPV